MKALLPLFLVSLFVQALSAQNVMISNQNFPNEPSIMMDPKQPNMMVAASNIDNYYMSMDTGRTWMEGTLTSQYGVWGDPCIAVDTTGLFYFFHLSNPQVGNWIDRIVCQKTTTGGAMWTDGTYTGLNGTKAQDKHWCSIDRTNNNIYLTWTQFDIYGSAAAQDKSIILFSKSLDGGATWSTAKKINITDGDCVDSDNTVEGAVPAVGPNGEIYVSWAGPNGIVFNKSLDQGDTWLSSEIPVATVPGGWDYSIPGLMRCNGLPVTVCDLSNGPNRGTIYVNWSDQRNGATNTDVWLVKSTDGGNTWSAPTKVNDDISNRHQFLTWMDIDQTNGNLYFVFYDRRNYADNQTDVYLAASADGGTTFVNRQISESPFTPNEGVFFGDYNNITVHDGIIRPIWTRLNNGQLSVWTHLAKASDILTGVEQPHTDADYSFENYPNPSDKVTYVSFKLRKDSQVKLSLYSVKGKEVKVIIPLQTKSFGKYVESIDLSELNIPSGTYFLQLEIDGKVKSRLVSFTN